MRFRIRSRGEFTDSRSGTAGRVCTFPIPLPSAPRARRKLFSYRRFRRKVKSSEEKKAEDKS